MAAGLRLVSRLVESALDLGDKLDHSLMGPVLHQPSVQVTALVPRSHGSAGAVFHCAQLGDKHSYPSPNQRIENRVLQRLSPYKMFSEKLFPLVKSAKTKI